MWNLLCSLIKSLNKYSLGLNASYASWGEKSLISTAYKVISKIGNYKLLLLAEALNGLKTASGTDKCFKLVCERFCWPDTVENVDEDEEECDEQSHATRDDFRLDEDWDPGPDDEHAAGQVDLHQVLHRLANQLNLEAARRVVAWNKKNDVMNSNCSSDL